MSHLSAAVTVLDSLQNFTEGLDVGDVGLYVFSILKRPEITFHVHTAQHAPVLAERLGLRDVSSVQHEDRWHLRWDGLLHEVKMRVVAVLDPGEDPASVGVAVDAELVAAT